MKSEKVKINVSRKPKKEVAAEKIKDIESSSLKEEIIKPPKPSRWLVIVLTAALILALGGLFFYYYRAKWTSSFAKLIPQEAVAFNLLKIDSFSQNLIWSPLVDYLSLRSSSIEEIKEEIGGEASEILEQSGLNFQEDIKPLYRKEIALTILPSSQGPSFVLIIETFKNQEEKRSAVFSKIEKELNKKYYLTKEIYRQVNINSLQPLSLNHQTTIREIHYLWLDNFLIVSDKMESLEQIIDTFKKPGTLSWH